MLQKTRRCVCYALCGLTIAGCASMPDEPGPVWAMNVGGNQYVAKNGTPFRSEEYVKGGEIGWQDKVKGTQDEYIYQSYREGDVTVAYPVGNGRYDLTLKFTEPRDYGGGERVFDVYAEGQLIIDDLDVMVSRDGKVRSAFTVTIPNIDVSDGELNIDFEASAAQPVLNALVVRRSGSAPLRGELLWSDEFDYEGAPDPAKWNIDIWPARKVNDEDQTYTARSKNLRVKDGKLIIEAHKEAFANADYTSARVHSAGKGDVLYGRVEVRAKLPRGKGTWPAIWMLPSDPYKYATTCTPGEDWQGSSTCNAWPNSGEIDIMEHVGYEMNHVHGTVHNEAYYWAKWEQRKGRIIVDGVADRFHTYALEWSPEEIRIYLDDHLYFIYMNENDGWQSWPYDHAFNLILNVAVGGMWGRSGGGIDDTIFPQRMEVDYVRVYARPDAK
ncbi:MAG: family 16 glycosylhydrolase [Gammaproteobacteria bacterium]|nr:family 16 glycosylhydrolase [Gammaproteobacteria bacterium]